MRWAFRIGITLALGLALAGCAGMVGAWPGALLALLMVLGLGACSTNEVSADVLTGATETSQPDTAGGDVAEGDATDPPDEGGYFDVAPDTTETTCEEGSWVECCVDRAITQCCCPDGQTCNYFFDYCEDGSCANEGLEHCPVPDVVTPDVADVDEPSDVDDAAEPDTSCDGQWQTCCVGGEITECCCPEGAACNFGWFDACADGSCAEFGGCNGHDAEEPDVDEADVGEPDVDEADAEEPDAGCDGYWEPCCIDGHVSSCCCPSGVACNYGWFNNCGNDTCTGIGQECPEES